MSFILSVIWWSAFLTILHLLLKNVHVCLFPIPSEIKPFILLINVQIHVVHVTYHTLKLGMGRLV